MTDTLNEQDVEQMESNALVVLEKMDALEVVDQKSFDAVQALTDTATDGRKVFIAHVDPTINAVFTKHRKLTAMRKRITDPYTATIETGYKKMDGYTDGLFDERNNAEQVEGDFDAAASQENVPIRKNRRFKDTAVIVDMSLFLTAIAEGSYKMPPLEGKDMDTFIKLVGLDKQASAYKNSLDVPGAEYRRV